MEQQYPPLPFLKACAHKHTGFDADSFSKTILQNFWKAK